MTAIQQLFNEWTGSLSQGFGVADDLRCVAMCSQEAGIDRKDYVEEAIRCGYKGTTAGTCWAFVKRQAA